MAGALDGIRVLDLTAIISGPMATMVLADQGADVVKVEPPGVGDNTRNMGTQRNGLTAIFAAANRNKRSLCLDLKKQEGVTQLLRLCSDADVFVQNFRPGAADRMGIGEDAVRGVNPDIIYVSIAGFGFDGPYAQRRVYDPLIQAACGMAWAQAQGKVDSVGESNPAELVRSIVCDKVTALTAAQAITAALLARERGSGGQHVKLNMLDSAIAFQWPDVMWNQSLQGDGITATPDLASMFRVTETLDGAIIVVSGSDSEFEGVCKALDCEEKLSDPKYLTILDRMMHIQELLDWQNDAFSKMTSDDACALLDQHEVPCAKVNRLDEIADDPQVAMNGSVLETDHPTGGRIRGAAPVGKFSGTPSALRIPAPCLGEHSEQVLLESGWSREEVQRLLADEILHQA